MVQTLVETIPGVLSAPTGLKLADLPFPRNNLALWASASLVTTSPFLVGGNPETPPTTGVDTFLDQQSGASYPPVSAQSFVTGIGGGGIPYARSRLGDATSRKGHVLPVGLIQNRAGASFYALARLTASAGSAAKTIFGSGVDTSQSTLLGFGFDASRQPRIVARRAAIAETAAVAVGAAVSLSQWVGMIAVVDYANNNVAMHVVGSSDSIGVGATAIGGVAGANSGTVANQGLGLGMPLNAAPPTTGTSSDAIKFTGGDIAEKGIFTAAISGTQLTGLKNYLRDMAKLLNG